MITAQGIRLTSLNMPVPGSPAHAQRKCADGWRPQTCAVWVERHVVDSDCQIFPELDWEVIQEADQPAWSRGTIKKGMKTDASSAVVQTTGRSLRRVLESTPLQICICFAVVVVISTSSKRAVTHSFFAWFRGFSLSLPHGQSQLFGPSHARCAPLVPPKWKLTHVSEAAVFIGILQQLIWWLAVIGCQDIDNLVCDFYLSRPCEPVESSIQTLCDFYTIPLSFFVEFFRVTIFPLIIGDL